MKSDEILTCCTVDQTLQRLKIKFHSVVWLSLWVEKNPGIEPEVWSYTTSTIGLLELSAHVFNSTSQLVTLASSITKQYKAYCMSRSLVHLYAVNILWILLTSGYQGKPSNTKVDTWFCTRPWRRTWCCPGRTGAARAPPATHGTSRGIV